MMGQWPHFSYMVAILDLVVSWYLGLVSDDVPDV
jgi:hypothetical protein